VVSNETKGLKDRSGVLVDDNSIGYMIGASNILLQDFAKAWKILPPTIYLKSEVKDPKPTDWAFSFIDEDPDVPGAAAFHYDGVNQADGVVLCKTILDRGGYVLHDPKLGGAAADGKSYNVRGAQSSTLASCFFHEVVEALMDASTNSWWTSKTPLTVLHSNSKQTKSRRTFFNGVTLVAAEVADPVQQNFVVLGYKGKTVALSDFILPAWQDNNDPGPFNYTKSLSAPFTIDIGGYAVIYTGDGSEEQVFSQAIPAEVLKRKLQQRRGRHRKWECHEHNHKLCRKDKGKKRKNEDEEADPSSGDASKKSKADV
jgi:hypothetical protein